MSAKRRADFKPHRNQKRILKSKARFRVVACGRRFGKTEVGKWAIVDRAKAGGECWWLSPTYRMAGSVWRDLVRAFRTRTDVEINKQDLSIVLEDGGSIMLRSTHDPDRLRGAGLDFAVLDEAAFMPPNAWNEVIRPMLLDRQGGALFLSTPYGRNWFWQVYQRGLDPEQREWESFHFSSYDNPLLRRDEIDALRAVTPDHIFRAEYLAEFVDDAGQVFRGIREAVRAPLNAAPAAGRRYAAGVDWGRSRDFTVIAIVDADHRQLVALDRFNQIGWEAQRSRLSEICARWQPGVIWAEENSVGAVNIEALQAEGLPVQPFRMSAASKAPLIEALSLAIERGDLALLPDEVLINELASYAMERLPGGGFRYGAPSGMHDDCVIALALAWHGAYRAGIGIEFG
ncbi:hypothetical protein FBR02_09170 [Anaerolineae bacterium CFX9]|nr:hypothetical protein [Anaerolineae bacterium CFX9]